MNIESLKKNRKERNEECIHIYVNILDKIWKKIKLYDENGEHNYLYEIPNIILGEPQYDKDIAESLIIRKMKKGGFDLKKYSFGEITYILIDWSKITKSDVQDQGDKTRKKSTKTKNSSSNSEASSSNLYKVTFSET